VARGGNPQPDDAFDRFAAFYDRLGFNRFSKLALTRCTDFLAESELTVARLLDLACGTGHFAIQMARRGIEVTGVDGSTAMLKQARANAKRMKNAPKWIHGQFTNFAAPGRYDLATCWFDSLNHLLTDAQLTACFRRVRRHLAPGGAFLFDVNTPRGLKNGWSTSSTRSTEGYTLIQRSLSEPAGEFAWLELEAFVKKGRRFERMKIPFFQRGLSDKVLARALRAARFSEFHIAPFDGSDNLDAAPRLLVSAYR